MNVVIEYLMDLNVMYTIIRVSVNVVYLSYGASSPLCLYEL